MEDIPNRKYNLLWMVRAVHSLKFKERLYSMHTHSQRLCCNLNTDVSNSYSSLVLLLNKASLFKKSLIYISATTKPRRISSRNPSLWWNLRAKTMQLSQKRVASTSCRISNSLMVKIRSPKNLPNLSKSLRLAQPVLTLSHQNSVCALELNHQSQFRRLRHIHVSFWAMPLIFKGILKHRW